MFNNVAWTHVLCEYDSCYIENYHWWSCFVSVKSLFANQVYFCVIVLPIFLTISNHIKFSFSHWGGLE